MKAVGQQSGPVTVTDSWQGHSASASQTQALGQAIARFTQVGDLIALTGELGAGKTQLVRGLAMGLGVDPAIVSSPTYVLLQVYERVPGHPLLLHVDAYRLDDPDSIGWGSDLFDAAVVIVEWADRLQDRLPDDRLEVQMVHEPEDHRFCRWLPADRGVPRSRHYSVR